MGKNTRTILICSGKGGVGKTTLTANLGIALANSGATTAVLDADFGLRNLEAFLPVWFLKRVTAGMAKQTIFKKFRIPWDTPGIPRDTPGIPRGYPGERIYARHPPRPPKKHPTEHQNRFQKHFITFCKQTYFIHFIISNFQYCWISNYTWQLKSGC